MATIRKAQVIRAMEAAGLFVEARSGERTVHGIGDGAREVWAMETDGGRWLLADGYLSRAGYALSEAGVMEFCRAEMAGARRVPEHALPPSERAEWYHDGEETFYLAPVGVAA
jgi:hypothetical protein